MAHKDSKRSQKYLEKYLRARTVLLHNERLGELSQLAEQAAAHTANCRGCGLVQGLWTAHFTRVLQSSLSEREGHM